MIDYGKMRRIYPKQKSRLTRALKSANPVERRELVMRACRDAVKEWDEIGAWPDEWSRWQRALDDQFSVFNSPRLEEL